MIWNALIFFFFAIMLGKFSVQLLVGGSELGVSSPLGRCKLGGIQSTYSGLNRIILGTVFCFYMDSLFMRVLLCLNLALFSEHGIVC